MHAHDFFKGIIQTDVNIGPYKTRYPIFYKELESISLLFLAPLEKVRSILPSKRMHPYRLTPWHCIVTITCTQYKDPDVGPYNQVSVGVPFVLDKVSPLLTGIMHKVPEVPMIYTFSLPVTTEIARVAGIEIANYPEFLSDIKFTEEDNWINCTVDSDGENILRLSVRKIKLNKYPRQNICPVTVKDNRLLRSEFNFSESNLGISKKQSDVQIEFGNHQLGLKLKDLSLKRVLQYQYYPSGQAILSMTNESYPY
jgi:hypothetical protein